MHVREEPVGRGRRASLSVDRVKHDVVSVGVGVANPVGGCLSRGQVLSLGRVFLGEVGREREEKSVRRLSESPSRAATC